MGCKLIITDRAIIEQPHQLGLAIPLRSCVMTKDESLSCCTKDEGGPLGFGNQILRSNHPMRHLLRVIVVSDREKAERICQVSSEEMNANEPLMRCRYG